MKINLAAKAACLLAIVLACGMTGCGDKERANTHVVSGSFDFEEGVGGWEPGFSDYPIASEADSTFRARLEPSPNDPFFNSYFVKGLDTERDLFIFIKRQVGGLLPNTAYNVIIELGFVSQNLNPVDVPSVSDIVTLKLGATTEDPVIVQDPSGDQLGYPAFVMSIDKGNDSQGGADMVSEGEIILPGPQETSQNIQIRNSAQIQVVSDDNGVAWVIIGGDSISGAEFGLYFDFVSLSFLSVEPVIF